MRINTERVASLPPSWSCLHLPDTEPSPSEVETNVISDDTWQYCRPFSIIYQGVTFLEHRGVKSILAFCEGSCDIDYSRLWQPKG